MAKGIKRGPAGFDQALGVKLRQVRLARDMSQEELGRRIGVTFQQVQKYEKGSNRIAVSTLVAIAEALTVPVATFLPDAGGERADVAPALGDVAAAIKGIEDQLVGLAHFHAAATKALGRAALATGVPAPSGAETAAAAPAQPLAGGVH